MEEAAVLEKGKNDDFLRKYLRAFSILSPIAVEEKETKLLNFRDNLIFVIEKLLQYHLPIETSKEIFNTLEAIGDFSKAEDLAFEILEEDADFKKVLIEFYEKILTLDDASIENGNLTRDEILISINDLKSS